MKIKNVITIILKFILSILIIMLTSLIILKLTLLNKEYMKKVLINENYYEKLSKSTREEMKNYLIQSGFTEEVIENIYTTEDIENDVNNLIDKFYSNQKISIDTTKLEDNLKNEITAYLREQNVEFSSSLELEKFVDLIADIYKDEVGIVDYLSTLQNIYRFISKLVKPAIVVLSALILVNILSLFLLNTSILVVPLLTLSIVYSVATIYLKEKIAIDYLLILSKDISNVIKYIFLDITGLLIKISIVCFVIAVFLIVLGRDKRREKNN